MEGVRGSRQAAAVLYLSLTLPVILHFLAKEEADPPPRRLILGVVSARDHFSQREAIRQTWGSAVSGLKGVEMRFVLGEEDCSIHPADRLSPFGCDLWHVAEDHEKNGNKPQTLFTTHYKHQGKRSLETLTQQYIGLGFKVIHPIIIKNLIVPTDIIKDSTNLHLLLTDPEEVIEEIEVDFNVCLKEGNLCLVNLPQRLRLPRGFEGELKLVWKREEDAEFYGGGGGDVLELNSGGGEWACDWSNSSVLEYKFLRTRRNTLTQWHESACSLVSMTFTIAEPLALTEHRQRQAHRREEWLQHLAKVQDRLNEEQQRHKDLLLLPQHIDTYNNLPRKVMFFLKWATHKYTFSYIMKTDDDTFINTTLLNSLLCGGGGGGEGRVWWSQFNHHRAVPFYGKWGDLTYPSLTYPSFPAGSGYIMTRSLVTSLVEAADHLIPHGGEDVSVGIWVSAVSGGARYIDVPCWLPHPACPESLLVPQLSVEEMRERWERRKR